jgi:Transposase zinc-binding domain
MHVARSRCCPDQSALTPRPPSLVAGTYQRRRPEETTLYRTLAHNWPAFLATMEAETDGAGLPRFVVAEVEAFLRCGILAHGFVRLACDACLEARLVAFSCKRRGFCPACIGRRMSERAAHLVDTVLPRVPVRQWVLTVPPGLRYRMAHDPC